MNLGPSCLRGSEDHRCVPLHQISLIYSIDFIEHRKRKKKSVFTFVLCVWVFGLQVCLCITCVPGIPGGNGCEVPCGCWYSNHNTTTSALLKNLLKDRCCFRSESSAPGATEKAHRLRTPTVLPKDLSSVLSTHSKWLSAA